MGTLVAVSGEHVGPEVKLHSGVIAMRTLSWAAVVSMLVACSSTENAAVPPEALPDSGGQSGAAGSGGSDGITPEDDASADVEQEAEEEAATGVACGSISCNVGEYCCDGTCGACLPIGVNCPPVSCPSDAAALESTPEGSPDASDASDATPE
jgi:hypothetical protein